MALRASGMVDQTLSGTNSDYGDLHDYMAYVPRKTRNSVLNFMQLNIKRREIVPQNSCFCKLDDVVESVFRTKVVGTIDCSVKP